MDCSLPYPLATDVSVQDFNTFIESNDGIGYKIEYKNGTVYIIDLPTSEHEIVISVLARSFDVPNGDAPVFNAPLQILGHPCKGVPSKFQLIFPPFFSVC